MGDPPCGQSPRVSTASALPMGSRYRTSGETRSGPSPRLFLADGYRRRSRSATRALLRMRGAVALTGIGTHDLRRTLATRLGEMGVPDEVIERVLNHAPRTVVSRHYNHARHFDAMRRALEAWANQLVAIIDWREPFPQCELTAGSRACP
jgi:integrase